MKQNGQTGQPAERGGIANDTTRYYADVLFMQQLNSPHGYTYEVPEHFVKDLANGRNIVVVEGRGGTLALAYVISKFKGNIQNDRIKSIVDVCTRVKMKPERVRVAESARTPRSVLF